MKRRRLSPPARAAMLERQGGTCIVEGCTETRGLIEEHSTPFAWTGAKADQLMCAACHKAKTRIDIKNIAKVRRIANGRTQHDRRNERGAKLKSNSTLRSAGFDKSLSKKMDGTVVKNGR